MGYVQKLPSRALDAIAEQVGRLYPSLDNSVTRHQPQAELTETFPIWTLSTDAIDTGEDNLLELAEDTHRWHSQILIDNKPEGVARSTALDGHISGWVVKQVLKGDLAKTVDDAIRWIDTEVESDPLVRILEVPAFFITALWLIHRKESSVIIAKCSSGLQRLNPLVQYSSQDFLEILRQESPVIGIRDERPRPQRSRAQEVSKRNTFNVLSIDTGVDGITPAIVLAEIEDKTGLPTADNFDLITGTSTGGVLALGLSRSDSDGKPQYKARDFVDANRNRWSEFFNPPPCYAQPALQNLVSSAEDILVRAEKFPNGPERALGAFFRDATLGDVLENTKTMVPYYDFETHTPFFLKSWEPEHTTVQMQYAAWATSATFTSFEPFPLPVGTEIRKLVDGKVFVNSLASAYEEAKKIISREEDFKDYQESDIFIFSIQSPKGSEEAKEPDDSQNLNFLGKNHICLRVPLSQADADDNMDNTSETGITQRGDLADKLIKSTKFHRVCNQLMAVSQESQL